MNFDHAAIMEGIFRSGTSGLVLAEKNKTKFPPAYRDTHRLVYYASQFNSIEINSSFYKIPRGLTLANWRNLVPANFQFSIKLWRGITHDGLVIDREKLQQFMVAIDQLGDPKGCLLIQFPPKAPRQIKSIETLLRMIREYDPLLVWKLALEFRHMSWYTRDLYALLDEFGASLVLHDMPGSIPPIINEQAPFVYLRFHGLLGDYRGSYPEKVLDDKAARIQEWLAKGKDVYAYFNNTIGDAVANMKSLSTKVGQLLVN